MSGSDDDAKTLVEPRGRSNTVSSDVTNPEPQNSFSPRVTLRRPQMRAESRGVKIDFAALPDLILTPPAISQEEDTLSKMEPPPSQSLSHLSTTRPRSCPIPLLAPPTNTNNLVAQSSSLDSSTRPSSARLSKISTAPPLEPYQFPLRQPQPEPSWLPAATRSPPKPTYLRTARDRAIAIHGPLHPVTNLPCPPPSAKDLRLQHRFRAIPVEPASSSPLELVYDTRENTFVLERRSVLLPGGDATPMLEMQENLPPLLVDGRMTVVDVPRWSKTLKLFWRSFDGERTEVRKREVELPVWVWMARNFGDRWKECFVR